MKKFLIIICSTYITIIIAGELKIASLQYWVKNVEAKSYGLNQYFQIITIDTANCDLYLVINNRYNLTIINLDLCLASLEKSFRQV
jgi:hypothetical protein